MMKQHLHQRYGFILGVAIASLVLVLGGCGGTSAASDSSSNNSHERTTIQSSHKAKQKQKASSSSKARASSSSSSATPARVDTQSASVALAEQTYSGTQTIEINGNRPTFTSADLSTAKGAWQNYAALDSLNRATDAEALLNKSLMPTASREELTVDPTGWHNKRIRSGYLYNRSHLIGYQLTGQNNNWKNLITGTRSLNSPEMLRYEDDIAYYLKQHPGNFVRYSVVPVFKGNNLLASGVHMMAQSVGDDGLSFNVYVFNVQSGVTLNYADGTSVVSASQTVVQPSSSTGSYAGNGASGSTASTTTATSSSSSPTTTSGDTRTVYIAPESGTKYHFDRNCRGLNNANGTQAMTVSQAQAQGYTLCGWED